MADWAGTQDDRADAGTDLTTTLDRVKTNRNWLVQNRVGGG